MPHTHSQTDAELAFLKTAQYVTCTHPSQRNIKLHAVLVQTTKIAHYKTLVHATAYVLVQTCETTWRCAAAAG